MSEGKMTAEELERALAFLAFHERKAFPLPADSKAVASIQAHISTLQREADEMREALSRIVAGKGEPQQLRDTDLVCAKCGHRAGHSDACEDRNEPWPTWEYVPPLTFVEAIEIARKALPPQERAGQETQPKE